MIINYVRPAEFLHSKECISSAIISAVQNNRDADYSATEFHVYAQSGGIVSEAYGYLSDGIQSCICPDPWPIDCDKCDGATREVVNSWTETIEDDGISYSSTMNVLSCGHTKPTD